MRLFEKVRIEVFIPDLPDPSYHRLLDQLETEFSYAFGGYTVVSASGSFRSASGLILPDKINILFADAKLELQRDRLLVGQYAERVRSAVQRALEREKAVLVSVYNVFHDE